MINEKQIILSDKTIKMIDKFVSYLCKLACDDHLKHHMSKDGFYDDVIQALLDSIMNNA